MSASSLFDRVRVTRDNCWQWKGAVSGNGYPYLRQGPRVIGAHRAAYEHYVGPIPDGYELHHVCSNPLCINPMHHQPVEPRHHHAISGRRRWKQ